ncbi:hypothetical protein [Magnetovibrio blakemorei]|nr:hypothetical protein [Magnetovibrio blakemorei]
MTEEPWILMVLAVACFVIIKLYQVSKRFPGLLTGSKSSDKWQK